MDGLALFLTVAICVIWACPKGVGRWLAECNAAYVAARQKEGGEDG
jgi:hypothetical protein